MSKEETTVCDVCGKKGSPVAGDGWATISIYLGWYGPHPWMTGPHASHSHDASIRHDVCSSECALKWLRTRIIHIEENVKRHADTAASVRLAQNWQPTTPLSTTRSDDDGTPEKP